MTNIVLLGGNGYIGRNTTKAWMKKDPDTVFYVISRSGKNKLEDKRIINIKDDVTSADALRKKLPEKIDYIVDFIGCAAVPEGSSGTLSELNLAPAKVMRELAESCGVRARGAVGGKLGSKEFVQAKKEMIGYLRTSSIPAEFAEPTLVIGEGRKDSLTKIAPLLKFLGIGNLFKEIQACGCEGCCGRTGHKDD